MTPHLSFHHLGLAVASPDKAGTFLTAMGYSASDVVFDPEQNANLQYFTGANAPDVELIFKAEQGETPGPLEAILKDATERIYHTCWQARDLDEAVAGLRQAGRVLMISPPKPAVLFGGQRVGFYHLAGFGLVEILENLQLGKQG